MTAQRIQRRRTKGWRMPEGAVYVGRPTRWGNPFAVGALLSRDRAVAMFAETARGIWHPVTIPREWPDDVVHDLYLAHQGWLKRLGGHPLELVPSELRGRDLACWCPLDQPCHADVLLEIANRSGS